MVTQFSPWSSVIAYIRTAMRSYTHNARPCVHTRIITTVSACIMGYIRLSLHTLYIAHAVVTYHTADKIVVIVSLVFVIKDEARIENEVALVESLLVAKLLEDAAMVERAR